MPLHDSLHGSIGWYLTNPGQKAALNGAVLGLFIEKDHKQIIPFSELKKHLE